MDTAISNKGKPWADDEVRQLLSEIKNGKTTNEIANIHKRTYGGIRARLNKMAYDYYTEGRPIDEICKFTGLSSTEVLKYIKRSEITDKKKEYIVREFELEGDTTPIKKKTFIIKKREQPVTESGEVIALLKDIQGMLKQFVAVHVRIAPETPQSPAESRAYPS